MLETDQIIFNTRLESRLKATRSIEEFKHEALNFIRELGFSGFDFQPALGKNEVGFSCSVLPDEFVQEYIKQELGSHDMLMQYALHQSRPIFQSEIYQLVCSATFETEAMYFTKKAKILDEQFGMYDCLTFPMHHRRNPIAPQKEVSVFSVYIEGKKSPEFQQHATKHFAQLSALAYCFYRIGHRIYTQTCCPAIERCFSLLSKREMEVLQQFAYLGVHPETVAKALNIAKRTVDKHAENIRKKLQVSSTHEAIMLGVKQKFIIP